MTQVPLPVDRYLPEILSVVADRHLVLVAPPGSGKPPGFRERFRGEDRQFFCSRAGWRRVGCPQDRLGAGLEPGRGGGMAGSFRAPIRPRTRLLVATEES